MMNNHWIAIGTKGIEICWVHAARAVCLAMAFTLCYFPAQSQELVKEYNDYFYFKNGHKIRGQLHDIKGDTIIVEIPSGKEVVFLKSDIRKIEQLGLPSAKSISDKDLYPHPLLSEKKHWFMLGLGINFGTDFPIQGLSLTADYHYRWKPNWMASGRFTSEILSASQDAQVNSLQLGVTHLLFPDRNTLVFSLMSGYGLPRQLIESWGVSWKERGGLRATASAGYLFRMKRRNSFYLGLDYMIQRAYFETVPGNSWIDIQKEVTFRRLFIKAGFFF